MMLPDYIQDRTRRKKKERRYRGFMIETYEECHGGNYRYVVYWRGKFVDGGGPYMSEIASTGRDFAEWAAEERIDQILEKGYN